MSEPNSWTERDVIADLLNHWSAKHKMSDFPECVKKARSFSFDAPDITQALEGGIEAKKTVPMAMLVPLTNGNIWTREDIIEYVSTFGYEVTE